MYDYFSEVDMQGVKPTGEFKELEAGTYIVRIEDMGVCAANDKFDKESGAPLPDNGLNYMVRLHFRVYTGPADGQEEQENLNLWNMNDQAVSISKSSLAAIQIATNTVGKPSEAFIGAWAYLEVYLNKANKLSKKWLPIPPDHIPQGVPALTTSRYAQTAAATWEACKAARAEVSRRKLAAQNAAGAQVHYSPAQATAQPVPPAPPAPTAQPAYTPQPVHQPTHHAPARAPQPSAAVPGWLMKARGEDKQTS